MRNSPQFKNPKYENRISKQIRNPDFQIIQTKQMKIEGALDVRRFRNPARNHPVWMMTFRTLIELNPAPFYGAF
jgi:hypothetical protein